MRKHNVAAVASLLAVGAAHAGTIDLHAPLPAPWGGTVDVAYTTVVTGFSADGNYVQGVARGYYCHGHSGRGGGCTYLYWCNQFTWDLSGTLVSTEAVGTYFNCPAYAAANYSLVFTNPINPDYTAGTTVVPGIYGSYTLEPWLETP